MAEAGRGGPISESILYLSHDQVTLSGGFALDIGSSTAKVLYRSNKEYRQGKKINDNLKGEKHQLHCAIFKRDNLEGITSFLQENCDFKRNRNGFVGVNTTGVGGSVFKNRLEEQLKARMSTVTEMNAFVAGFMELSKTFNLSELVYEVPPKAQAMADGMKANMQAYLAKAKETGQDTNSAFGICENKDASKEKDIEKEDKIIFPCLFAMCGSGTLYMPIKEDGTFEIMHGPMTGGRFFHGLAAQLTGIKDFGELIKMAAKGDGRSIDSWAQDLIPQGSGEGQEADAYNILDFDVLAFPFGKIVDENRADSEVKTEDLAYSAYHTVAFVNLQFAMMLTHITSTKHVYFSGNLFDNETAREMMYGIKGMLDSFTPPDKISEIHFMKNGAMLGALGAFLTPQEMAPEEESRGHTTRL